MSLGSTLKEGREKLGLSLRDVEKKTNKRISNGYLSLLESDEVKQPSPRHLHMLATVLELDYGRLMQLANYVVPSAPNALTGFAFAGWEDLTDSEKRIVEQSAEQMARILRAAREGSGG